MAEAKDTPPLSAIRVFVMIARQSSVTQAAHALGITQSSASRHLAVLERYLGAKLIERRGRYTTLTDFGRLFAEAVGEPLDAVAFTVKRMRRSSGDGGRLVVRTSMPTFAYSALIPNLQDFTDESDGAVVDVLTALTAPDVTDSFDVLVTRDLEITEPSDQWDLLEEQLVCVGPAAEVAEQGQSLLKHMPFLLINSRPDSLPRWLGAMGIVISDIKLGARYDHHFLALPAAVKGQGLLVTPEIVVAELVRRGDLGILPGSRLPSGMRYRAYALDRGSNPDLSHSFCRWLHRLCKRTLLPRADAASS